MPVIVEVVYPLDPLDIHRQPLQPVGEFGRGECHRDAADLLEIGELGHLHAVAPDFPAQAPGADGRVLPVVLDEADVVQRRIDADRAVAVEQQRLAVRRRRLQQHLVLVVVLQPVRVFAVAAVGRAPARLHVGGLPGPRTEGAKAGMGRERAGADLDVVRLQDGAALARPELVQPEDQRLEAQGRWAKGVGRRQGHARSPGIRDG